MGSFSEIVILSNSWSRCGGNTIFEGRTVKFEQNCRKKRKKNQKRATTSKKMWFGDHIFRAGRGFGQILGPVWQPSGDPKRHQSLGPVGDRRFSGNPGRSQGPFSGPWVSFLHFFISLSAPVPNSGQNSGQNLDPRDYVFW